MGARTSPPETSTDSPQDKVRTSPDRHRDGARCLSWPSACRCCSSASAHRGRRVASTAPTRSASAGPAGQRVRARTTGDISAHNSPTLVRNPVRPDNLAVSSRIDTPVFGCALHVSLDGGARWTQTEIPIPKGEGRSASTPTSPSRPTASCTSRSSRSRARQGPARGVGVDVRGRRSHALEPKRVGGELSFQVRLAADPVNAERVYMTWLKAPTSAP